MYLCTKKATTNNAKPEEYINQKFIFKLFAKKKGTKNKYDIGTPNRILFAKITELSVFLCSK